MPFAVLPADLLKVNDPTAPSKHGAQPRKTMAVNIRLHDGFDAGKTLRTTSHDFG
jgi:hypothetical protein